MSAVTYRNKQTLLFTLPDFHCDLEWKSKATISRTLHVELRSTGRNLHPPPPQHHTQCLLVIAL